MGGTVGVRALVPQDILLRALRNARDVKELSFAFMLRDNERAAGLSVNFDQTPAQCQAGFRCTYGVASLTVQSVADAAAQTNLALQSNLALQVVPDAPNHANIIGVPHKDDNPVGAERLASELAKLATLASNTKVDNRQNIG